MGLKYGFCESKDERNINEEKRRKLIKNTER